MATNKIAYGFMGMEHLFQTRVAEVGVARIWSAIQESAAEHTRTINALMAGMVERTTQAKELMELAVGGVLQPLDEWGNPRPIKPQGSYEVAYPIRGGGTAYGGNRVTNAHLTVEEANRFMVAAQVADAKWLTYHMLAALLDNGTWTYRDETYGAYKGLGNITIQPLANGDAVTYLRKGGAMSTDTHYLAQADAIDDSHNPFPTIHTELTEHPGNEGPVVVYVPTNLVTSIEALTAFVEVNDPDIELGSGSDRLVGSIDRSFGDEVLGKVSKCWIVEWKILPDSYMIAVAQGAMAPPLKMREYPATALQGLFTEAHSPDGNLTENRLIRYAGFGAYNRIAALVYRIGNANYATPTGWDTPLVLN